MGVDRLGPGERLDREEAVSRESKFDVSKISSFVSSSPPTPGRVTGPISTSSRAHRPSGHTYFENLRWVVFEGIGAKRGAIRDRDERPPFGKGRNCRGASNTGSRNIAEEIDDAAQ